MMVTKQGLWNEMNDHDLEAAGLRLVAIHIHKVQSYLADVTSRLIRRAVDHDQSKYAPEERGLIVGKPAFDKYEYMSEGERAALAAVKDSLVHHYANNSHHPEHFKYAECGACFRRYPLETAGARCEDCGYNINEQMLGVDGMSLLDLLEMVCDWKAAGEMTAGGSFQNSINLNTERFNLSPQLLKIIENTGHEMGWLKDAS